jgi:hypothetical protein
MSEHAHAAELAEIHAQLPATLKFPIANAGELVAQIPPGRYTFRKKAINVSKGVDRIPAELFPITSLADFDHKVSRVIRELEPHKSK